MKAVYFAATALVGAVMFWVGFQARPVLDPWEQQEVAAVPGDESVEVQQTEQPAVDLAAQGYLSLEELTVRIDDGDVQWFDGVMWHTVAPVEELAKEDKFYATQEGVRELEEQLKQQREDRRAEQESVAERGETLLVGQKEEPKPTEKPKPTKPAVTAPVSQPVTVPELVPEPTAAPENSGGGNSGGGNSGGGGGNTGNSGNSGGGGGNSGNSGNSGGGDSGNTGNSSGGDSGNTGDSGNSSGGDSGNSGSSGGGDSGNTGDNGNSGGGDSGDTGDGENMEWSDDYL